MIVKILTTNLLNVKIMESKASDELLELASTYLALSQLLELPEWQQEAITTYFSILLCLELE